MNVLEVNVLVLAYLGDTIYENYVRKFLVNKGIANVNDLQKNAIKYVSATSQSNFLKCMIDDELLSEEEINVVKRARNYKSYSKPKSCDVQTYKNATGLEALIGHLDYIGNKDRINEIMSYILK